VKRIAPSSQHAAVPQFYTTGELAASWKVSRAWIHHLHMTGRLRGVLIGRLPGRERGGVLRFQADTVADFLGEAGTPPVRARGQGGGGGNGDGR